MEASAAGAEEEVEGKGADTGGGPGGEGRADGRRSGGIQLEGEVFAAIGMAEGGRSVQLAAENGVSMAGGGTGKEEAAEGRRAGMGANWGDDVHQMSWSRRAVKRGVCGIGRDSSFCTRSSYLETAAKSGCQASSDPPLSL